MQLTQEQLKERKSGIGGSDCAAALGLNKWLTPLDIYLSKINPDPDLMVENDAMKDGHDIEPIVIKRYMEATGSKVRQPNKIFRNKKYPWMLANVDGLVVGKNIILEAKTTRYFTDDWGEIETDYIPDQYLYQVAHYCIVLNKPRADIAGWSFGQPLRIYHYHRNKELEQQIIDRTHDFWYNNVLKHIPPNAIDNADLLKLYRKGDETKSLIADDRLSNLAHKDNDLKNEKARIEKQINIIQSELKLAMGENVYLLEPNGDELIHWGNRITNRFKINEFKMLHPKLYKKFCSPSPSRAFTNKIK